MYHYLAMQEAPCAESPQCPVWWIVQGFDIWFLGDFLGYLDNDLNPDVYMLKDSWKTANNF